MALTVTSSAFKHGEPIPRKYTGEGSDVSPPLSWTGMPEGTKEIALICDDPDAPIAEPWVHWVIYGLPHTCTGLGEGVAKKDKLGDGSAQGRNSFGRIGYNGPMPPPGHGVHHYHFKLYALDRPTGLKPGATKKELLRAMEGHILAQGDLVGTYKR